MKRAITLMIALITLTLQSYALTVKDEGRYSGRIDNVTYSIIYTRYTNDYVTATIYEIVWYKDGYNSNDMMAYDGWLIGNRVYLTRAGHYSDDWETCPKPDAKEKKSTKWTIELGADKRPKVFFNRYNEQIKLTRNK